MNLNTIINVLPIIVAAQYATIGFCYLAKKDLAWFLVWISYSLANLGLVLVGLRNSN